MSRKSNSFHTQARIVLEMAIAEACKADYKEVSAHQSAIYMLSDVDHAVSKVASAKYTSLLFLKGPRGKITGGSETDAILSAKHKYGVLLVFANLLDFVQSQIYLAVEAEPGDFMNDIISFAEEARVSDDTKNHIKECAKAIGWYAAEADID